MADDPAVPGYYMAHTTGVQAAREGLFPSLRLEDHLLQAGAAADLQTLVANLTQVVKMLPALLSLIQEGPKIVAMVAKLRTDVDTAVAAFTPAISGHAAVLHSDLNDLQAKLTEIASKLALAGV